RLQHGLTPWRRRASFGLAPLWPVAAAVWSERWEPQERRLRALAASLRGDHACVLEGGAYDRWDLEVRGGILGAARLVMGAEDHAGGKQLLRIRWWPVIPVRGPLIALAFAGLALAASQAFLWTDGALLALGAVLPVVNIIEHCMAGMATIRRAIERLHAGGW
ncbi:MAG: glycosyltransferase, partial [Gemmatimonadales bacterium]